MTSVGRVPALPDPGEFTHDRLVSALAEMVGATMSPAVVSAPPLAPRLPPQLDRDGIRAVVVVVVDGLGAQQLAATSAGSWLREVQASQPAVARSVLPSTTSANLASMGTGLTSGRHGVLGYTMVVADQVFNTLSWRSGVRGGSTDMRSMLVPETLTPAPTMFERLHAGGTTTLVVMQPEFLDSGLTRVAFRGGPRLGAAGLRAGLDRALAVIAGADGPAITYVHHPDVDTSGHLAGPHTPRWRAAVDEISEVLNQVVAGLADDVAVVVTADHGMVAVDDADVTSLDDGDPLLAGVTLVAGEPRMRTLVVPDDPAPVLARWSEAMGDHAIVVPTADAVGAGWFGPGMPDAHAARLGDVIVASLVGSVPHARVDPHGGRLLGMHGSVTSAERDVPLLVLTRNLT